MNSNISNIISLGTKFVQVSLSNPSTSGDFTPIIYNEEGNDINRLNIWENDQMQ